MDSPLPFLNNNENAQPELHSLNSGPWPPRPMEPEEPTVRRVRSAPASSNKADQFEFLKGNPLALLLLGIVIGFLIANMRPMVIQPK